MKVLTIGLSPYLMTARGRLHESVIKGLFLNGNAISSIVWGHDTNYFIPEDNGKHYYSFNENGTEYKIPLNPTCRSSKESIFIYEIISQTNPDVVVMVGDISDFAFIKAVRMFLVKPVKWFCIHTGYSIPINEKKTELIEHLDGIICTNPSTFDNIKNESNISHLDWAYVGCEDVFKDYNNKSDRFKVMTSGKNVQTDNLPVAMEVVSKLRKSIPDIELYIHSNIYDQGEYDLNLLKQRFDPKNEFISFPKSYVSINEGMPDEDYAKELSNSDIFINTHMISATSMSIFESLSCNTPVLATDCGSNSDISTHVDDLTLINSHKFVAHEESYLYICDEKSLYGRILELASKIKGKELSLNQIYRRDFFIKKMLNLLNKTTLEKEKIYLETN